MEWILVVIFSVLIILVKKNRSKIKGIVGEKLLHNN